MLKSEVKVGHVYRVKLHGTFTNVKLLREAVGGWYALNLTTDREVRIKSAAKLRHEVSQDGHHHYEVVVGDYGIIYSGMDQSMAEVKYDSYTKISAAGHGNVGHKPVTMLRDGATVKSNQS